MKHKNLLKVFTALTLCTAAASCVTLFGCAHTHEYGDKWETNENYHWHEVLCGHEDAINLEAHQYDDDTDVDCNICGYIREINVETPPVTQYTVKFNMNGHGTQIEEVKVDENGKLSKPTDPTDSEYDFKGWFTDEECESAYDFNTAVTGDLDLYALWEKKSESGTPVDPGFNNKITLGSTSLPTITSVGISIIFENLDTENNYTITVKDSNGEVCNEATIMIRSNSGNPLTFPYGVGTSSAVIRANGVDSLSGLVVVIEVAEPVVVELPGIEADEEVNQELDSEWDGKTYEINLEAGKYNIYIKNSAGTYEIIKDVNNISDVAIFNGFDGESVGSCIYSDNSGNVEISEDGVYYVCAYGTVTFKIVKFVDKLTLGENTLSSLNSKGTTFVLQNLELGEKYTITVEDGNGDICDNALITVDGNIGNPLTFTYSYATSNISIRATGSAELTNLKVYIEVADNAEDNLPLIEVGQEVEQESSSWDGENYKIELEAGTYNIYVKYDGGEFELLEEVDMSSDVAIFYEYDGEYTDGLVDSNEGNIVIETDGTYYISAYFDLTFKIVKV